VRSRGLKHPGGLLLATVSISNTVSDSSAASAVAVFRSPPPPPTPARRQGVACQPARLSRQQGCQAAISRVAAANQPKVCPGLTHAVLPQCSETKRQQHIKSIMTPLLKWPSTQPYSASPTSCTPMATNRSFPLPTLPSPLLPAQHHHPPHTPLVHAVPSASALTRVVPSVRVHHHAVWG